MEDAQIAHLAGVMDAVGSITVHIQQREQYSTGHEFRPVVRIIRGERHAILIGKLDEYASQQGVHATITEKEKGYEFVIYDAEQIERFLRPMMPYLVSAHEPATVMLEEVVPAVKDDKHLTKQGLYDLVGHVETLRATTARGDDAKYTQEYFEKEFGDEITTRV